MFSNKYNQNKEFFYIPNLHVSSWYLLKTKAFIFFQSLLFIIGCFSLNILIWDSVGGSLFLIKSSKYVIVTCFYSPVQVILLNLGIVSFSENVDKCNKFLNSLKIVTGRFVFWYLNWTWFITFSFETWNIKECIHILFALKNILINLRLFDCYFFHCFFLCSSVRRYLIR